MRWYDLAAGQQEAEARRDARRMYQDVPLSDVRVQGGRILVLMTARFIGTEQFITIAGIRYIR